MFNTVYILSIMSAPYFQEHVNSVHLSQESAEIAAEELRFQLPRNHTIVIEPYDVEDLAAFDTEENGYYE